MHNDKWKNKARRSYQRKHNLDKNGKPVKEAPNSDDSDSISNSRSNSGSDSEGDVEEEEGAKNTNAWRFMDPLTDPELLKDPDYLAQIESQKRQDRDQLNHDREIVLKSLLSAKDQDVSHKYNISAKKARNIAKMKEEDILNFNQGLSDNDETDSDNEAGNDHSTKCKVTGETREFTEEERDNFLRLQAKIAHQRKLEEMKRTLNKHKPLSRSNIYEMTTTRESPNYKYLVEDQLRKNIPVVSASSDKFESLVDDLLGVDLTSEEPDQVKTPKPGFDLDSIIPTKLTNASAKSLKKPKAKLELHDDFLDSIL